MLRFIFNLLLSCLLLGVIAVVAISLYILPQLPDIETLRDVKMQVPLRIYSQDMSLIAEFGEKRRTPIDIENAPEQLVQAFLSAEDDRFFEHPGVDWQGILRAVVNLVKTGRKTQGGSTITMQVARNFFLSREKSYLRKLNEIFLSFKIERELSKDEILELYLNKIYLGQRAYGVGAAARVYYGNDISKLSLAQLAMIAGLPKAPSTTNPISNPERAMKRRNYVLKRMFELGYIDKAEFDKTSKQAITASLHSPDIEVEAPYVAEMVRKQLTEQYGEEVYSAGFRVVTTIRDKNQAAANHALRQNLLEYDERHGYRGAESQHALGEDAGEKEWKRLLETYPIIASLYPALVVEVREQSASAYLTGIGLIDIEWEGLKWARRYVNENRREPAPKTATEILQPGDIVRVVEDDAGEWKLSQIPAVEGGLVSLQPDSGATLALVGGFDFNRSKFNRITQSSRQPGSCFKPFIYSAALEAGHTAASIINDAPVVFDDPGIEDIWRPENYSGKNYGLTRLREALIRSRNLISIRLLKDIGVSRTLKHVEKFGFDSKTLPKNLSLALGSGSMSPWTLAGAYAVLANGGFSIEPYFIDRIETYEQEVIFQAEPLLACYSCNLSDPTVEETVQTDPSLEQEPSEISELVTQGETPKPSEEGQDSPVEQPVYAERKIDARNIAIMHSITRDVITSGTGRRARVLQRSDLSGKTGTTNNQRDAWFAGFNPSIVAVSWVGFDDFQPLGESETGARAALPMWINYMRTALDDVPLKILERPPGLVNVRIDRESGKLARADQSNAIFELFRSEYVPTEIEEDSSRSQIPDQLF